MHHLAEWQFIAAGFWIFGAGFGAMLGGALGFLAARVTIGRRLAAIGHSLPLLEERHAAAAERLARGS